MKKNQFMYSSCIFHRGMLRRRLGRGREFGINVHATYAVTRKPEGGKQGQGKGAIDRFVSAAVEISSVNDVTAWNTGNALCKPGCS